MKELTKEYFDTKLDGSLKKLGTSLKKHTEEQIGELAGMVSRRFNEVEKMLDLREEVDQLKTQMKKVWAALNIAQR